jgi:Ca2+-binding RTX toxin-like protein
MYGGGGDDLYWVDNAKDRAFEFQGGGTDGILTTLASVSLSDLMSGHVENLQGLGASTKFSLTGNGLDNQIAGDAGHDVLKGLSGKDKLVGNAGDDRLEGGTGDDILVGGTGYDFFVFAKGWGVDRASDFIDGVDRVMIKGASFADLRLTEKDGSVEVEFKTGPDMLVLEGLALSKIGVDDFLFV